LKKAAAKKPLYSIARGKRPVTDFLTKTLVRKQDSREAFMARGILKLASALLAVSASVGAAQAGGFSRGTADTDILYEDGNFNIRAGATIVSPTRKFTANAGNPALIGTDYANTYVIPTMAIKLNVNDDLRCAGTFVNVYGGDATYVFPTGSGKKNETFTINEWGATCGYKFDLAKGRVWVLGGIFAEVFDYDRLNLTGLGPIALNLSGTDVGYRIGAAYEIPEIALRAQLMYRSGSSYGASGTLTGPAGILGLPNPPFPPATQVPIDALGIGDLPQSVELKLQSGIAPGWLAFGSVKWTDWSVLDTLDVRSTASGALLSQNQYFWKDGWTVSAGIGHAFNEKLSGAVQLTWDQGVKTGWDLSSDTWTLGVGGSYKDDAGGEFRLGLGATYIASAAETKYPNNPLQGFNTAVGAGMAYAVSASYKVKW
jgi:long-chain fatty acid transport protein